MRTLRNSELLFTQGLIQVKHIYLSTSMMIVAFIVTRMLEEAQSHASSLMAR